VTRPRSGHPGPWDPCIGDSLVPSVSTRERRPHGNPTLWAAARVSRPRVSEPREGDSRLRLVPPCQRGDASMGERHSARGGQAPLVLVPSSSELDIRRDFAIRSWCPGLECRGPPDDNPASALWTGHFPFRSVSLYVVDRRLGGFLSVLVLLLVIGCADTDTQPNSGARPPDADDGGGRSRPVSASACVSRWNRAENRWVGWLRGAWRSYKLRPAAARVWLGPSRTNPELCTAVVEIAPRGAHAILRERPGPERPGAEPLDL
jgi:hypothetical protein